METFWAHDAVHFCDGVGLVLVHGDDGVLVVVPGEGHELGDTSQGWDCDGVGLVLVHGDDGVLGGVVVLAGAVLRFWPGLKLREGVGY